MLRAHKINYFAIQQIKHSHFKNVHNWLKHRKKNKRKYKKMINWMLFNLMKTLIILRHGKIGRIIICNSFSNSSRMVAVVICNSSNKVIQMLALVICGYQINKFNNSSYYYNTCVQNKECNNLPPSSKYLPSKPVIMRL